MHRTSSREQLLHKVVEVAPEKLHRNQSIRNRKQVLFIAKGEKAGTSREKCQKKKIPAIKRLEYAESI